MKSLLLLVVIATAASAQGASTAAPGAEYLLRVRAADTTKQAEMRIAISGDIFASLGATKAANGGVSLGPGGGTGSGTVVGSLMAKPGKITFSSGLTGERLELVVTSASGASTPHLVATGRSVSVVYASGGGISVQAVR